MSLGDDIGADIKIVSDFLTPILGAVPSPVTQGIMLGLRLLAVAEPAAYNAIEAAIQGTPLTPVQEAAKTVAISRLMNPEKYFA